MYGNRNKEDRIKTEGKKYKRGILNFAAIKIEYKKREKKKSIDIERSKGPKEIKAKQKLLKRKQDIKNNKRGI